MKNLKKPYNLKEVVAGQDKVVYSIIRLRNVWKIKCTFYSHNKIKLQRLKWVDYHTHEEAINELHAIVARYG